jgi:small subunit ribosomal protein S27Ae
MQILLNNLEGETITYVVQPYDLVEHLKTKIAENEGISASEQRLIFGGKLILSDFLVFYISGKHLEDGHALDDYGIYGNATLHLALRLLGAGKKRKKKVYTTPKKIKHKRKKVKLSTLKYYKVGKLEI